MRFYEDGQRARVNLWQHLERPRRGQRMWGLNLENGLDIEKSRELLTTKLFRKRGRGSAKNGRLRRYEGKELKEKSDIHVLGNLT